MPSLPQQLQFQAPLPQPATMKLQAMDFQDKQRRTDLYERQIATSEETLKFNKMQKTLEMGKQFIPQLTKEEYPKFKKWVKSIGGPSELLPDEAPEDFEPFKEKLYYGADNITKSSIEQYKATIKQAEDKKKEEKEAAKRTPVGLEKTTNRTIVKDAQGNLTYQNTKEPYKGGQLQPLTESAMITMTNESGGFSTLGEEDKNYWYEQYAADKTALPPFYYRDPKSKNAFTKGFAKWQKDRGVTGGEAVAGRETVKSYAASLKNQQKQRGMMGSFVGNIEKQLSRVDQISGELQRFEPRLMNVPMVEWRTQVAGSGKEKAFQAYLLEISNEIAKLSTGSQASIRELSTEAQERWGKIHDPNLSLADLKIVLAETQNMARMRLESTDEEITKTIDKLSGVTQTTGNKQETTSKKEDPLGIR